MKKFSYIIFILALGLASCKKDRTCKCNTSILAIEPGNVVNNNTQTTHSSSSAFQFTVKKTTKKNALQSACASYTQTGDDMSSFERSANYGGQYGMSVTSQTITVNCELL